MNPAGWRQVMLLYLVFVLAFPLGMWWVETHPAEGPAICLFRQLTSLDCPSCGLTRAFRAMGRLDVLAAIHYNPLGPAVFLGAVVFWCYSFAMLITRGHVSLPCWWQRWHIEIFWGMLAVFLLAGFGRILYELHHPPPPPLPASAHWLVPW